MAQAARGRDRRGRPPKPASPTMRRTPQGRDAEEIVDAIITAAEHVLEHEGLDVFSTNRVADIAGVSIGSLYRYFPNKYALARGVHERHLRFYKQMIGESRLGSSDVRDYIVRVGNGFMAFFAQRTRIHRALWRLRTAAEVHESIEAFYAGVIAETSRLFHDVGVPAQRAEDLAFVLVHAADGVANAVALRGDPELGGRTVVIVADLAAALIAPVVAGRRT